MHVRGNHGIVATSSGCTKKFSIFDSIYPDVDNSTKELIIEMCGIGPLEFEVVPNAPKQKGNKVYGVIAIAVSISLASHYVHKVPLKLSFNQNVIRDHLIYCFSRRSMKLFP